MEVHPKTVKIRNENGELAIINESDFNPEVHQLFDQPAKEVKGKAKAETPVNPPA